jgi:ubiquinone/menaquinone biosynthesis C-methylase UbiE
MPTPYRIDYDRIAHLYDEAARDHDADANLRQFLDERPWLEPARLAILDMGCGTGKQLAANQPQFPGALLVGLDYFGGMLRQAQRRGPDILWVQGDSAAPPFCTAGFHYITNQFSYPHVRDKPAMMAATFRLLKPGGRFVMTNIDPWSMPGWILYRYFPAAQARDHRDFLPVDSFVALMQRVGFSLIKVERRRQGAEVDLGEFLGYAAARFRTSQLLAIPDADYEAGLRQIRLELAQAEGRAPTIHSEISLVTIRGDKAA